MSTWPLVVYGCSALLALALLYFFRARSWYWHVLSVAAAFGVGLAPIPKQYNNNQTTLIIGSVFFFLLLWGFCAPLFRRTR